MDIKEAFIQFNLTPEIKNISKKNLTINMTKSFKPKMNHYPKNNNNTNSNHFLHSFFTLIGFNSHDTDTVCTMAYRPPQDWILY